MDIKSTARTAATSRMSLWLYISIPLMALIIIMSPQKLGLVLYKVNLITIAAWLGYWIDRGAFPYARPDQIGEDLMSSAMIRRALIIASSILAMAMGL